MNHEQQLKAKFKAYCEIRERLEDIAKGVHKIHSGSSHTAVENGCAGYLDDIELDDDNDNVNVCFSEYYRGSTDYSSYSFPTSYLWNPDWEETEKTEMTRRNLEAVEKRQQKEKEDEKKREEQSYRQYLALKKKFEGMKDLDPEIRKVVDENFWDLLEGGNNED